MARLLPLFPLQLVVFPSSAVPLHIFEERYREMVGEAEAAGSEFGIVLARDGGIVNSGCTVIVEEVMNRYPDGRFDVLTRGQRRFSIVSVNQDEACLRAEVEYFDDEDAAPASLELRTRALKAFARLCTAAEHEGRHIADDDPDADHPQLSFQLAQAIEDLDFQNTLQRNRSESDRLRQFAEFVEQYVPQREYVAKMKRAAPTNGFGHKPHDL